MGVYSHSRLSTFEQCKFKYKIRYIENVKPTLSPTIESFLGDMIHRALEWLYTEVGKKNPSMDDLIKQYADFWEENWNDSLRVVKITKTVEDYFNYGVKFLIDYYQKYKPFDENVLGLEKKIFVDLLGNGKYTIIGFIDKLNYNPKNNSYEIHDYKTSATLKEQEELDMDRQLALYSMAVKKEFGNHKDVCLIWHFLAFDKEICSKRTNENLEQLKEDIIKLIDEIENNNEWLPNESILCNWCEYRAQCPLFEHEYKNETQKELN